MEQFEKILTVILLGAFTLAFTMCWLHIEDLHSDVHQLRQRVSQMEKLYAHQH